MRTIKILLLSLLITETTMATELKSCTEKEWAGTQYDMTKCAGIDYEMADRALNKVYKQVREYYKDNKEFLKYLKKSQLAWIKLRDANQEMIFLPGEYYGTASRMCTPKEDTLQRIEYLRQWITEQEKDACNGSRAWYER